MRSRTAASRSLGVASAIEAVQAGPAPATHSCARESVLGLLDAVHAVGVDDQAVVDIGSTGRAHRRHSPRDRAVSMPRACASPIAVSTFRDPPLVEMPRAMSPLVRVRSAASRRRARNPTSLPSAVRIAGSSARLRAGSGRPSGGAANSAAIDAASVALPPLPNVNSDPPVRTSPPSPRRPTARQPLDPRAFSHAERAVVTTSHCAERREIDEQGGPRRARCPR